MWFEAFVNMNAETQFFIIVILLFNAFFHVYFTPSNAQKAPAFLTTLGILGTFIGIAIGLWGFDPENVQKSVPILIGGIKTAVWASAMGIFCALTIKLRDIFTNRAPKKKSTGATADDIADLLQSIDESLAGEGEDSLIEQMKQTRKDQREQAAAFKTSLDGFYQDMAEKNTKALVAALSDVIKDFNLKLNEQFGDNFKQLNQACEKLLTWQQEYSQQVDALMEQQKASGKTMEEIRERHEALISQSESFSKHAESMSKLLTGMETQRHQMEASLSSLGELLNTASTGLPQMEKRLDEMTKQLTEGMVKANNAFNANMGELIGKTKEQVLVLDKALSEELTKSLESFGGQLATLSQKFADDYGPITERLNEVLKIGK
ncbi:MAG: hypothetical protein ACN2B6_11065 [Rickettsiales bacterium]